MVHRVVPARFPDTAYGWRKVAPRLAEAGWRVVAPFMRGYAPSSIPADGGYHVGALMDDALRVRSAAGRHRARCGDRSRLGRDRRHRPGRDARQPVRQSGDHVGATARRLSRAAAGAAERGRLAAAAARANCCAAGTSSTSNCLGCLSVPRPGYCRCCGGGGHPAIATPTRICATSTPRSGRRRAGARRWDPTGPPFAIHRPPAQYAELDRLWTQPPILPSLYLHGRDDGCMTSAFAYWTEKVLPAGSEAAIVEHAGHFLQLEQPDKVAKMVLAFIGSPG